MNVSKTLSRGSGDRARKPARDHSVLIVVVMMMTLVFAPVVGLHLAAPTPGSREQASSTAPATDIVVAAPTLQKEPG